MEGIFHRAGVWESFGGSFAVFSSFWVFRGEFWGEFSPFWESFWSVFPSLLLRQFGISQAGYTQIVVKANTLYRCILTIP